MRGVPSKEGIEIGGAVVGNELGSHGEDLLLLHELKRRAVKIPHVERKLAGKAREPARVTGFFHFRPVKRSGHMNCR